MFFITKDFSKEIMKRSKLRNNFLKKKTYESRLFALSKEITRYPYQKNVFWKSGFWKNCWQQAFLESCKNHSPKIKLI